MTSDAGLLAHFKSILDVGPTVVYNVPKRCQDIAPSVMLKLAEHENFMGIKECAGTERIEHDFFLLYFAHGERCAVRGAVLSLELEVDILPGCQLQARFLGE